jgi:hypothetical protein
LRSLDLLGAARAPFSELVRVSFSELLRATAFEPAPVIARPALTRGFAARPWAASSSRLGQPIG